MADVIKLDVALVERKLSQMIQDKKFLGTLDQGSGYLIVYESHPVDPTYTGTLRLLGGMGKVVMCALHITMCTFRTFLVPALTTPTHINKQEVALQEVCEPPPLAPHGGRRGESESTAKPCPARRAPTPLACGEGTKCLVGGNARVA